MEIGEWIGWEMWTSGEWSMQTDTAAPHTQSLCDKTRGGVAYSPFFSPQNPTNHNLPFNPSLAQMTLSGHANQLFQPFSTKLFLKEQEYDQNMKLRRVKSEIEQPQLEISFRREAGFQVWQFGHFRKSRIVASPIN